jgi:hypothetical protein
LFSAGLILLAEKVFLRLVAINFHEKALAERLAENRLGLKALDRLSNAQPVARQKAPNSAGVKTNGKGHKAKRSSLGMEKFGLKGSAHQHASASGTTSARSSPINEKGESPASSIGKEATGIQPEAAQKNNNKRTSRAVGRKTRKKAMAAIIVDQLGAAVGQVALKNSKFNREGEFGSLESARKLARKLFYTLNDVYPPREHLLVEGKHH